MTETQTPGAPVGARLVRATWHLLAAGILLYGLVITGFLMARVTVGERWDTVAYANNFIPWWALGGVVAALIGLGSSRRWLLIALQVPGVIAFVVLYGPALLPAERAPVPPTAFTTMTYNVIASTSDPQRITAVIAAQDADLVGVQELGPVHADMFGDQLGASYPYQALYPGLPVHGVGLLSRYPIRDAEEFEPLPGSMRFLRATVDLDGMPVTVYVVHPCPPVNVLTPITYDDRRRNAEIAALYHDYLRHERGPLLVLGDFNMSDQSDAYALISQRLHDAFRVAGQGLGFTFPATIKSVVRPLPLLLRIDYVWYDDHFTAYDAYVVGDSGTSDHRSVVATLNLNQDMAQK